MRSLASPICRSKGSPNCYHGTGNPPRLIPPLSKQHDRSCSPLAKAMSPRPSAHAYLAIQNLADIHLAPAAAALGWRDHRLHQCPFDLRQIAPGGKGTGEGRTGG